MPFHLHKRPVRAFSLLELIVVLVVLGLLAAVAIPTFARASTRAEERAAGSTLEALGRSVQALAALSSPVVFTDALVSTAVAELDAAGLPPIASGLSASGSWSATTDPVTGPNELSYAIGGGGTEVGFATLAHGSTCVAVKVTAAAVSAFWATAAPCDGTDALDGDPDDNGGGDGGGEAGEGVVTGLAATPGDGQVTLTWTGSLPAGGAFQVAMEGVILSSAASSPYVASGVPNGAPVTFTVTPVVDGTPGTGASVTTTTAGGTTDTFEVPWSSYGATDGIFDLIGTSYGTATFDNPLKSSEVVMMSSTPTSNGVPSALTNKVPNGAGSQTNVSGEGAWFTFDFGPDVTVSIDHYALRGYDGNSYTYPRSWDVHGSNDGDDWELVDSQVNNTSGSNATPWVDVAMAERAPAYRFLRFTATGPTSSGFVGWALFEVELWGAVNRVTYTPSPDATESFSFASFGDANGLFYHLGGGQLPSAVGAVTAWDAGPVGTTELRPVENAMNRVFSGDSNHLATATYGADNGAIFDLGPERRFRLREYTMFGYTGNTDQHMRGWVVHGSNDRETWVLLDQREDDFRAERDTWVRNQVRTPHAFRYFKVAAIQPSQRGSERTYLGELELYGELVDTPRPAPAPGSISLPWSSRTTPRTGVIDYLGRQVGGGTYTSPYPSRVSISANGTSSSGTSLSYLFNRRVSGSSSQIQVNPPDSSTDPHLIVDLGAGTSVRLEDYALHGYAGGSDYKLRGWRLEGSVDGTSWVTLDEIRNASPGGSYWQNFHVSDPGYYRFFRLTALSPITSKPVDGGPYLLALCELELYGQLLVP